MQTLPTRQQRMGVAATYRKAFGSSPTSPTVSLRAGYKQTGIRHRPGQRRFGCPNVTYTYIDPGLSLRFGATDRVFLTAAAEFILVLDTGEIQQPEEYGVATVTGLDSEAGIEVLFGSRYLLRAAGRFSRIGYSFAGNANKTDCNGDGQTDVFGAADHMWAATLPLAFTFEAQVFNYAQVCPGGSDTRAPRF